MYALADAHESGCSLSPGNRGGCGGACDKAKLELKYYGQCHITLVQWHTWRQVQ